jgi:hypothetical protein
MTRTHGRGRKARATEAFDIWRKKIKEEIEWLDGRAGWSKSDPKCLLLSFEFEECVDCAYAAIFGVVHIGVASHIMINGGDLTERVGGFCSVLKSSV